MQKFKTWGDAREYFHKNILPMLPVNEDETVEDRFMNWIEAGEVVIEEAQDTADSDAYDLATHN